MIVAETKRSSNRRRDQVTDQSMTEPQQEEQLLLTFVMSLRDRSSFVYPIEPARTAGYCTPRMILYETSMSNDPVRDRQMLQLR